jgi:hypothetical protein
VQNKRRLSLVTLLVGLVVVAAIVVGAILLFGGGDDDGGEERAAPSNERVAEELRNGRVLLGPRQAPFAMRYTNDWTLLSRQQLAQGDPPSVTGLRRKDRTGVLTVSIRGPVRGGIGRLEQRLPDELRERFPDFRLVTIRRLRVAAGPALYTSWIRTQSGRVQSNLVVPVGSERSFSVDSVLNANARDAAAEVGAMFRTFDTAPAPGG